MMDHSVCIPLEVDGEPATIELYWFKVAMAAVDGHLSESVIRMYSTFGPKAEAKPDGRSPPKSDPPAKGGRRGEGKKPKGVV